MRFSILTFVTLSMLFTIGFMTVVSKDNGISLERLYTSLEKVQDNLFNVTSNTLVYKNPYSESFTFTDFLYNTAHGVMYSMFVEINTLLGISIRWFYNHVEFMQMVFLIKLIVFLAVAWIVSKSIIPVGAIYVFYEDIFEKKKIKINKILTLTLAILTWLLVLALLFILIEVVF